jgi:hypothetical protein
MEAKNLEIDKEREPEISIKDWIGEKAKIVSFEIREGEYGHYVILKTEEVKGMSATAAFGLVLKDGKLKIRENSKADRFLKHLGIMSFEDSIGKEVTFTINEKGFLTFI